MYYRHVPLISLRNLGRILTAPVIYVVIVPAIFLDIVMEVYQRICFPIYGIALVSRPEYIRIDRHRLAYLSGLEKINCIYCGYINGLFAYVSRIAAETEWYWCGIKHARNGKPFSAPKHHKDFLPYNNEQALQRFIDN